MKKPSSRAPAATANRRGTGRVRPASAAEERLYDAVTALLRAYQSRDRELPCYADISLQECYALERIIRCGGASVTELARALRLDKSNASRITASLAAKGYLVRATAAGDRRAVRVSATAAGQELERRIKQEIVARQQAALARFPSAVRSALPDALNALAGSVVRPRERK